MTTLKPANPNYARILWAAVGLAVFTALSYILIGFNLLGVGDLQTGEKPAAIIYVAAGCYLVGGLLVLARRRWLWMLGAGINALVILFFFRMYQDRLSVVLSPGGLVSKITQILLEALLLYLIFANWRKAPAK